MDYVKKCNHKAKEMNMLTWLYDEDKWPSGFGGGFVTKTMNFEADTFYFHLFSMKMAIMSVILRKTVLV